MPRLTYPKRRAIKQALEMQDSCFTCVKALEADLRESADKEERARIASTIGGLGRNWTALQDAIRILKGDPLPGSLKPVPKAKQPKRNTRAILLEDFPEDDAPPNSLASEP